MSIEYLTFSKFPEDLQFPYNEGSEEFQNLEYAIEFSYFSVSTFSSFLEYVFYSKYEIYCSSFGYSQGVQIYSPPLPLSTSSTPTISGSVVEFYHMRLLGFLQDEKLYDKTGRHVISVKSTLLCVTEISLDLENVVKTLYNSMKNFLENLNDFVEYMELPKNPSFPNIGKSKELSDFISKSFLKLSDRLPDKHMILKKRLDIFFILLPKFFQEVDDAFSSLDKYNNGNKLKSLKSTFASKIYFEVSLQPNDNFFVEWGPVLDLKLFNEAMRNSKINDERMFLRHFSSFMKLFLDFQENYIRYTFSNLWLKSCRAQLQ
ncbi:hypothetical protein HMI56_003602 [Coelomomyces lativittatus]|nr:hypothetical protein HMI56_003602 [Coelomomyces lativittatus]